MDLPSVCRNYFAATPQLKTMRQLSGHDAGFLCSDTARSNANLSLLNIFDQSTAPGARVRFKFVLASDGLGLAYAITRYDGRAVISPTSCRELMPDP